MIRRPPRSTRVRSSAASDVYKRQVGARTLTGGVASCPPSPLEPPLIFCMCVLWPPLSFRLRLNSRRIDPAPKGRVDLYTCTRVGIHRRTTVARSTFWWLRRTPITDQGKILQHVWCALRCLTFILTQWRNNRACKACNARGPSAVGGPKFARRCFLKFFWGRGGPFGILARGPTATLLRHCLNRCAHVSS